MAFQAQYSRGVPVIAALYSLRRLRKHHRLIAIDTRLRAGHDCFLSICSHALPCTANGRCCTGSAAPFHHVFSVERGRFQLSEGGCFLFLMRISNDLAATTNRAVRIRPLSSWPRERPTMHPLPKPRPRAYRREVTPMLECLQRPIWLACESEVPRA